MKERNNPMGQGGFKDLLKKGGFQSFLWTQFFGALNDNLYKIIVSMRAVHVAAATGSGSEYLSLAGVVFVVPFLLFSGYSGHLADAVARVLINQMLSQRGYVVAPLPQRGQDHGDHIQPVIEIAPESSSADGFLQVPVGGRD